MNLTKRKIILLFSLITLLILGMHALSSPIYIPLTSQSLYDALRNFYSKGALTVCNSTVVRFGSLFGDVAFGLVVAAYRDSGWIGGDDYADFGLRLMIMWVKMEEEVKLSPIFKGYAIAITGLEFAGALQSSQEVIFQHCGTFRHVPDQYLFSANKIFFINFHKPPEVVRLKINYAIYAILNPYVELRFGKSVDDLKPLALHLKMFEGSVTLSLRPRWEV